MAPVFGRCPNTITSETCALPISACSETSSCAPDPVRLLVVLNLALFALLVINPHGTSIRPLSEANLLIRRALRIFSRDRSCKSRPSHLAVTRHSVLLPETFYRRAHRAGGRPPVRDLGEIGRAHV